MGGLAVRMLMASPAGSEVGRRFAQWVSREPRKVLARRFGASERTAQSWREGVLPQSTTLTAMVEEWGLAFLEYVFAPVLSESDLSVDRRLTRIEGDLAAIRDQIGGGDRAARQPTIAAAGKRGVVADEGGPAIDGAAAGPRRGMVRGLRTVAASAIAATLIGATLLQQIGGPTQDMARLRAGPARVVRSGQSWGGREDAA